MRHRLYLGLLVGGLFAFAAYGAAVKWFNDAGISQKTTLDGAEIFALQQTGPNAYRWTLASDVKGYMTNGLGSAALAATTDFISTNDARDIVLSGNLTATAFVGDGSLLTGVSASGALTNNETRDVVMLGPSNYLASITTPELEVSGSNPGYIAVEDDSSEVITINGANGLVTAKGFVSACKAAFSTNYTVAATDSVLFCSGTNQLITLLNATNATPVGRMLTVVAASTTGSVIVTNANGVQTVLGGLSVTVPATNRLTVVNDGANWW